LIKPRHVILCIILVLGVWALLPPRDKSKAAAHIGSDPSRTKNVPATVKYVLRVNPGPLYLPGIVPENSTKPIAGMQKVADAFEKLYPDTRIEFIGVNGEAREWVVTQLTSGQAPDILQTNVEDVWQDIQKPWYVPLDKFYDAPNPFIPKGQPGSEKWWDSFKYPVPTRGTMAPDGHMYCIVLDMIETGIYYNKTLFNRLRLSEPRDWNEFLHIQKVIKDAGYTPLLVDRTCLADWGVDLIFEQFYGDLRDVMDLNYDPRRGEYLHGYLDWDELVFLHDKGFFTPGDQRWNEVWRTIREWRPYMSKELNPQGTDFVKSFATQKGAMYWSHSMTVTRLENARLDFQYGIFYLPPITQSYSRFARGKDMCVIGGSGMQYCVTNSAVSDTPASPNFQDRIDKSERLKRVIAFLQFLTTPENCNLVVNEQVALLPNIKGVEPHPPLKPFDEFLKRHYSMTKWLYTFDNQWNQVLIRMLELYANDGIEREDFIKVLEQDLERATKRLVKRKALDTTPFEKVWNDRAEARKQFTGLPTTAPADDAK
jgi:raffinose/stachyose/melibiose transport system substrate-binding protein